MKASVNNYEPPSLPWCLDAAGRRLPTISLVCGPRGPLYQWAAAPCRGRYESVRVCMDALNDGHGLFLGGGLIREKCGHLHAGLLCAASCSALGVQCYTALPGHIAPRVETRVSPNDVSTYRL